MLDAFDAQRTKGVVGMNRQILGLLAVAAMVASVSAHAQLTSVDGGLAVEDSNGLEFASVIGTDVSYSPVSQVAGSAQAWINTLNAENYGGYNNWSLATGNGSVAPNNTTNQLGELFYTDNCATGCSQFTALKTAINTNMSGVEPGALFFSSSVINFSECCGLTPDDQANYWVTIVPGTGLGSPSQGVWTNDSSYGLAVDEGDALAVRKAPEIDPASAASGLTLLLGGLAVMRGRRKIAA
jgi:hypothetical protein